jgi:hypothetical protein
VQFGVQPTGPHCPDELHTLPDGHDPQSPEPHESGPHERPLHVHVLASVPLSVPPSPQAQGVTYPVPEALHDCVPLPPPGHRQTSVRFAMQTGSGAHPPVDTTRIENKTTRQTHSMAYSARPNERRSRHRKTSRRRRI